jgi:hypothetical protein
MYRSTIVILVGLAAVQVVIASLQAVARPVMIEIGSEFPLSVAPVEGAPPLANCSLYIICTVGCRACAALAEDVRRRQGDGEDGSTLEEYWVILGGPANAVRFAEENMLSPSTVGAGVLSTRFPRNLVPRYLSVPATPLRVLVNDESGVLLVSNWDLSRDEWLFACKEDPNGS